DTGEGPRRQYHEKVHQKQEKDLRTPLQRLFQVMSMSVLGTALNAGFQFAFKSLDEPTEVEKADVADKKTTTVVSALDAN
ncbi:phage portal protein, partial [Acinetobacter baumannii]